MVVETGNSQTEIGTIPKDWEVVKVKDITTFHKQGYYTKENYKTNGKYYLLRGTDMQNPEIDLSSTPKINANDYDYNAYKVIVNDFLIVRSGAIGRYGIVENPDLLGIFGSYLINFRFNDKIKVRYFGQLYQSQVALSQLLAITQGGANLNINAENIKALKIPLPSLPEQTAIATALSDMDELIAQTEKLIEKKKAIKQGVMQELLRPKEGWVTKKLGELVLRISTGLNPRTNFKLNTGGSNFYVTIKNFKNGKLFLDEKCDKIDDAALNIINNRSDLRTGDILLASIGRVGDLYLIKEHPKNWNINESVFTLRPNQSIIDSAFLCCLFGQNSIKSILDNGATGSTFQSIKVGDLKKLQFSFPQDLKMQKSISSTLFNFDNQLEKLEIKHNKLKLQKQGMMQALLTGKIRLV